MQGKSLYDFPIHLGLGATAVAEPEFTGMEWYDRYIERHGEDLDEGRLVSLFGFEESWTSWEMHPAGEEVVCCLQGRMTLHQDCRTAARRVTSLDPATMRSTPAARGTLRTRKSRWLRSSSPRGRGRRTGRAERSCRIVTESPLRINRPFNPLAINGNHGGDS